jgi:hypothetical protein
MIKRGVLGKAENVENPFERIENARQKKIPTGARLLRAKGVGVPAAIRFRTTRVCMCF